MTHPQINAGTRTAILVAAFLTTAIGAVPTMLHLRGQVTPMAYQQQLYLCADRAPADGVLSFSEMRIAYSDIVAAARSGKQGCDMDGDKKTTMADVAAMANIIRSVLTTPRLQTNLVCGNKKTEEGEECDDGNIFNDDSCTNGCKKPRCGDGIKSTSEQCDDSNTNENDMCTSKCTPPRCGDTIVSGVEECDDGNLIDQDACSNTCKKVATDMVMTVSVCGNGILESAEECDDGNTVNGDACPSTCTITPFFCGNRVREGVEKCDDGNINNGDACPNDCGVSICGDGKIGKAEECDKALYGPMNETCSPRCTLTYCGDSVIQKMRKNSTGTEFHETCDDGVRNGVIPTVSYGSEAVYCTAQCMQQLVRGGTCGDFAVQPSGGEECDDGNANNTDFCTNTCKKTRCGDGIRSLAEQCDDGNTDENDACTSKCTQPRCGDGIVSGIEECDDGNTDNTDMCSTTCKKKSGPLTMVSVCGNGILEEGERCDDGNTVNNVTSPSGTVSDNCSAQCLLQEAGRNDGMGRCGDGIVQGSLKEECDDANSNNLDTCSNRCAKPVCGDGKRAGFEECDDGNSTNTDFCSNDCKRPVCGNGITESTEECDDGNMIDGDSCPSNCRITPMTCGNGVREGVERCDDGNVMNSDSCPNDCGVPVCGNGKVDSTEECDLAINYGPYQNCSPYCTLTFCGDGIKQARYNTAYSGNIDTEACDEGTENIPGYDAKSSILLPYSLERIEVLKCSLACRPITMFNRYCGDGIVEPEHGEECDDANKTDTDGCTNACKKPFCGDGIKSLSEQCDDGNTNDNDGCTTKCQAAIIPGCGNGVVENYPEEECDDRNTNDSDGCRNNCKLPRCGDGILDSSKGERCDDGINNGKVCTPTYGNACNFCGSQCQLESVVGGRCGDRVVQPGEACDDGKNGNDHDTCTDACTLPTCGDHIKDTNEECDDGNRIDGDACSNACKAAKCGDGVVQTGEQCDGNWAYCNPKYGETCTYCGNGCMNVVAKGPYCGDKNVDVKNGEDCDDGNTIDTDSCPNSCRYPRCGDGVKTGVEQCDDGNTVDGDACTATCQTPRCGDYVVSIGEECDDGNGDDKDDCSNTCKRSRCGDGITQSCWGRWFCRLSRTEECDDGNTNDTDFCTNACMAPRCGDGIRQGSEQCDDGNRIDNDACTNLCLACDALCQRTR